MGCPKVSIVMPVYNAEEYLHEAIDSILNQTYTNFEFLIVDDGSSDSSIQIIEAYNDTRIVLISNEYNMGIARSLNRGVSIASGEYVARMDADDVSLPTRIEEQVRSLEANRDVSVCGTFAIVLGTQRILSRPVSDSDIKCAFIFQNSMIHPTVMIRREHLANMEYSCDTSVEDYELWFQMVTAGFKFCNLDKPLLQYRVSNESLSRPNDLKRRAVLYNDRAELTRKFIMLHFNVDISIHLARSIYMSNDRANSVNDYLALVDMMDRVFVIGRRLQLFKEKTLRSVLNEGLLRSSLLFSFHGLKIFRAYILSKVVRGRFPSIRSLKFLLKCLLKV